jgi:hypothetical protein
MGVRAKSIVAISALMVILGVFFFFSGVGWKFGAIVSATACLTILSLGGSSSTLAWLTLLSQLATFIYLLGPAFGNNEIFSFGSGAFNAMAACDAPTPDASYQVSDDAMSVGWFDAQSYGSDKHHYAARMPGNPAVSKWGYCARPFIEWKVLVALLEIVLSGTLFVLYTIASFTTPGPVLDGARKPLLG